MAADDRVRKLLDEVTSERNALADQSEPLKVKRRALQEQIAPLEAEVRALTQEIVNIEKDDLYKLDKTIGQLHKALGAKSMAGGAPVADAAPAE